ncbi:hypothetical protein D9M71_752920 [compost metagenome]
MAHFLVGDDVDVGQDLPPIVSKRLGVTIADFGQQEIVKLSGGSLARIFAVR